MCCSPAKLSLVGKSVSASAICCLVGGTREYKWTAFPNDRDVVSGCDNHVAHGHLLNSISESSPAAVK